MRPVPRSEPASDLRALGGTRTPNLLIRSQMLYPLSYERSRTSISDPAPWLCAVQASATEHSGVKHLIFRSRHAKSSRPPPARVVAMATEAPSLL
jgi:hypothetical protein